jgi:hypothetical protein
LEIIRKNFGLKVLSLALAVVGWAYFRFQSNPSLLTRFDQQLSVPIVAANLPAGLLAHYAEKEAIVTVSVKRGEAPIKPGDVKAMLDLSDKSPGAYNVPVQLVAPTVIVESLRPATVSVTIEKSGDGAQ